MESEPTGLDPTELDLPDTVFARDIDDRVFQEIAISCLSKVKGVSRIRSSSSLGLFESLFGKGSDREISGISVEQDAENHSVDLKIEVNVAFGESIPEKAEEIQAAVNEAVTQMTGLHVGTVHVVVKNVSS